MLETIKQPTNINNQSGVRVTFRTDTKVPYVIEAPGYENIDIKKGWPNDAHFVEDVELKIFDNSSVAKKPGSMRQTDTPNLNTSCRTQSLKEVIAAFVDK